MKIQFKIIYFISAMIMSLVFTDCKTSKNSQESVTQEPLKEIMPGVFLGYLSKEEIPNSLALIPPPPAEGSAAFALDEEYAKKAVESKDTARFHQAFIDAELYFPGAVKSFESTVGIKISEQNTPRSEERRVGKECRSRWS